ncbi:hypothetical protein GDO81_014685 [Engystomops pustulosus]|uniref:Uncharacterized protein n=1 Tax=Engystomops pustulosus TaxID=76066 RepID=A0AAV7BBY6_ENGPU|nr:hypothetical protein GDO81_014685 [Engystomops pustulosus]
MAHLRPCTPGAPRRTRVGFGGRLNFQGLGAGGAIPLSAHVGFVCRPPLARLLVTGAVNVRSCLRLKSSKATAGDNTPGEFRNPPLRYNLCFCRTRRGAAPGATAPSPLPRRAARFAVSSGANLFLGPQLFRRRRAALTGYTGDHSTATAPPTDEHTYRGYATVGLSLVAAARSRREPSLFVLRK